MSNIELIESLDRPSGLVPGQARARKAWVSAVDNQTKEKLRSLESDVRFEVYEELDRDVLTKYIEILRVNNADNTVSDLEQTMNEAGKFVASQLK